MTDQAAPSRAAAGKFRAKLLVAMMVVSFASTATVLYVMQRRAESDVTARLEQQFQSEARFLLGAQEARMAAITERCRVLARSVRIRAALEENVVDDLYLTAAVELRDVLEESAADPGNRSLRAEFFRFLSATGEVMPPPGARVPADAAWEAQLTIQSAPADQQIGYIVMPASERSEMVREVIVTPIVATDTREVLGSIVLGFKPVRPRGARKNSGIESGILLQGQLYMPPVPGLDADALNLEVLRALPTPNTEGASSVVQADRAPHLLFHKLLNPGSPFPEAHQVCLYSLAESLARQRLMRWQIVGAGLLVLLGGLVVSHFVSTRFSAPVEKLVEASAEHLAQRERAEAALELSREELLVLNAELQAALGNLKETQQHVIQQERLRALGQMASGIAHDFNNALVPILGFCELLLLSPEILRDEKSALSYLETIQTAAKDASSVVSRLREFYRADKGDKPFEPVNLKRLVEQAVTLTRPRWKDQAQAAGATVLIALDLEAVPPIAGEEAALREALTNLIFNGVDAMPHGGTLTLRTRSDGDRATIEVADTGNGMTEAVRKRCLEPFFSTKGERGTGLGLSMVFGIVQRHSGALDLRSEPGKGTTFSITLPLMDAALEQVKELPVNARPARFLSILVVDDEAPVRDTLAAVLSADGHDVEVAKEGAEGLKRFAAGKFDLVVTDKAMPGMNGDQMATAIKQFSPETPIILLTGFGLFYEKEDFPSVDVLASKPIRISMLREAIANALEAA